METAGVKPEEGGDDVRSAWPLRPGLDACYNGRHKGKQYREVEPILKAGPSWDRGLKLAPVNPESLVIVDQLRHGECVPESCTHRPSSHLS